jgi:hypothetical protein
MNERYEQLMARAWIEFAPDAKAVTKRFAQLIAEDCAKMLDEDSYIMPELGGYAHDIRSRYGVK